MVQRRVPEGASFAHEVSAGTITEQLGRIEALDSKAGILMATDGVLAGLLLGRGSLLLEAPRLLTAGAVGFVVASLILALLAFANRRYDAAPSAEGAVRLMAAPEEWLKWRFLGSMRDAIRVNRKNLLWKARLLTLALTSLIAAVGLLGAYFIYALLTGRLTET